MRLTKQLIGSLITGSVMIMNLKSYKKKIEEISI